MKRDLSSYEFRPLEASDWRDLAALVSKYAEEIASGASVTPPADARLLKELLDQPFVHRWGAFTGQELVGFVFVFELPEAVFCASCGQMDDLYVIPGHRGKGIARRLIESACNYGRENRWSHLRWLVPKEDTMAIQLYEKIAQEASWRSFVIRLDASRSL